MTDERLPDGPDREEMIRLIRDTFPDAVVATIDSALEAGWIAILNPSHASVRETLMPLIAEGHPRLASRKHGSLELDTKSERHR